MISGSSRQEAMARRRSPGALHLATPPFYRGIERVWSVFVSGQQPCFVAKEVGLESPPDSLSSSSLLVFSFLSLTWQSAGSRALCTSIGNVGLAEDVKVGYDSTSIAILVASGPPPLPWLHARDLDAGSRAQTPRSVVVATLSLCWVSEAWIVRNVRATSRVARTESDLSWLHRGGKAPS